MFIENKNMSVKIEIGRGLDGGITKIPQSTQGVMTLGPLRVNLHPKLPQDLH